MSERYWILDSPKKRIARWDTGNIWRKSDHGHDLMYPSKGAYSRFGGPASRMTELRVVVDTKDVPDFVWTVPDCMIRGRVLAMFRDQGFKGFEVRPVQVRVDRGPQGVDSPGRDEEELEADTETVQDLWELLVTGWGGIALADSGVIRVPNTNIWEGLPDWSRIVDWDAWDASDLFIVWPFGFTRLVSDRVAKFIRKQKLTGVRLVAPEAYTRAYRRWNIHRTMPLRLRDHFPEERAREIGEPLGIY